MKNKMEKWMMKRGMILAFISLLVSQVTFAQRITRQYNNVSFSAALKDLNARQDKYSINFVYDELEDFRVTKSIRNQSVPDAIQQLIGFYPIKDEGDRPYHHRGVYAEIRHQDDWSYCG